jgi:hypothetical protein
MRRRFLPIFLVAWAAPATFPADVVQAVQQYGYRLIFDTI